MSKREIIRKCGIINDHMAAGGEHIPWDTYYEENQECEIIIAEWLDEMIPQVVIYIPTKKMKNITKSFKVRPLIKLHNHGNYYVAGFSGNHLSALSILGSEDVIRFLIACFGSLDDLPKRSSTYVPILHL